MTTIQIKGIKYHSHPVLSCGDYSNNGMVGISNIQVILGAHEGKTLDVWAGVLSSHEEQDFDPTEIEVILVRGNYSSKTLFIREDLFAAYETQLDNYPLLDEEDYCNREYEQACEDWADYGAKEFLTEIKKKAMEIYNDPDLDRFLDEAYNPSQDDLWKLYNENTNYGSCYEGSSTYFYIEETIEEIAKMDFFRDLFLQAKEYSGKFLELASDLEAALFE